MVWQTRVVGSSRRTAMSTITHGTAQFTDWMSGSTPGRWRYATGVREVLRGRRRAALGARGQRVFSHLWPT